MSTRPMLSRRLDGFFFVVAGVAAVWLTVLGASEAFRLGWWWAIPAGIAFWALLAYLVLPRIHRILSGIYVPDYFIGRTLTSDGLLGDPVNLAVQGDEARLRAALSAAGWTRADPVTARSSLGIIAATLRRRPYPSAPVSPLMLFGRQQDLAYQQEVDGSPSQRHHVRFWRCPPEWPLPGGRSVDWLAASTFDRSVGLSLFTLQVTHKVAADTDVERDRLVGALRTAGASVEIIEDFSTGYHARNGGGDTIETDGNLPIVDVRPFAPEPGVAGVPGAPGVADAPDEADGRPRRPASVAAGTALILFRAIAGVGLIAEALTRDVHATHVPLGAVTVGVVLAELLVVAAVWRGSATARTVVLAVSVVSIAAAFVAWIADGMQVGLQSSLITTGLDVLVLLALSSRDAAAWTHRPRSGRRR